MKNEFDVLGAEVFDSKKVFAAQLLVRTCHCPVLLCLFFVRK